MSAIENPIQVPIRLDAVWSDGVTAVSPPTADFTQLRATIPAAGDNISDAQPWLGDTVRLPPNDTYHLPQGIHLHWTLPKALRHGTTVYVLDDAVSNELVQQGVPCALVQALRTAFGNQPAQELTLADLQTLLAGLAPATFTPLTTKALSVQASPQTYSGLISAGTNVTAATRTPALGWDPIFLQVYGPMVVQTCARMKLPPVPNRWLVIRQGGADAQAWVVESDRLSAPNGDGSAPDGAGPTAVPATFSDTWIQSAQVPAAAGTFQYLGLATPAGGWQEAAPGTTAALAPLTAAGHGLPDFAAFYPNCQGVFGFCDAGADETTAYTYTVIGWFSDATQDPASPSYAQLPWSAATDAGDRLANLGWDVPAGTFDGSLYTAQIQVTGSQCTLQTPALDVNVAIGNTAGEALSAFLAQSQSPEPGPCAGLGAETLLDAAQAGLLRESLNADGGAMIRHALHRHTFQAIDGGSLWQAIPISSPGQSDPSSGPPPAGLGALLDTLNTAQRQFDRTQDYLRAQRQALFTDWCRALHLDTDDSVPWSTLDNQTANPSPAAIGTLAATLVDQSASMVHRAGMANGSRDHMLAYRAAVALYLAHAAAGQALQGTAWQLKRQPAPRYWCPNDPVVLLYDAAGGSSSWLQSSPADPLPYSVVNGQSLLVCTAVTPGTTGPAVLPQGWSSGPSALCVSGVLAAETPATAGPVWRPVSLLWQVAFNPYPGAGQISGETPGPWAVTDYDPSFISGQFSPDAAGIDLAPNAGVAPDAGVLATYNGRVIRSSHAAGLMRERILRLAGQDPATATTLDTQGLPPVVQQDQQLTTLLADTVQSGGHTLAQALDGFNDRLRMLRRIPQLNVFDPGFTQAGWYNNVPTPPRWDSESQSFFDQIGRQALASPQQDDIYNPIRAGQCQVNDLSLIDAFGQIASWATTSSGTCIATTLPAVPNADQSAAPPFLLPPRLAQPGRLLFRWLAADGTQTNADPATTPLCGWVALNRVDETILVFAADGTLLGWIATDGSGFVPWPPGGGGTIADPLLAQVVNQAAQSQTTAAQFYDDLATSLLTITPRAHHQHTMRSVLVSRPLALARASLLLEVQGTPAPHQGYEWLITAPLESGTQLPPTDPFCPVADGNTPPAVSPFVLREHCGFTQVGFPVRLGDVAAGDDGLLAFWTFDGAGAAAALDGTYTLSAPSAQDVSPLPPDVTLTCEPGTAPAQLLLLLDPRAPVHATSGILPTEAFSIPAPFFVPALRQMEFVMTTGPVLAPAEELRMPLPGGMGTWAWAAQQAGGGAGQPVPVSGKVDDRAHPTPNPALLQQGWLQAQTPA